MYPLDRLEVYLQALAMARACAQHASLIRDLDLRVQLLRSVRSIAANLAEGAGSGSQAVFARHIAIALGSTKETECHLQMAFDAGLLPGEARVELQQQLDNLAPRLVRLRAAVRRNVKRPSE